MVLPALAVGLALASAPGPVQAVLLAEAARGGVGRGLRAVAGAAATFGALLVALALGVTVLAPSGLAFRIVQVAGGAFLVWMAAEAYRTAAAGPGPSDARRSVAPALRGSLAVVLNPGAWLFLATAAHSLLATAARQGGRPGALAAALALLAGAAAGDAALVILGGLGLARGPLETRVRVRRALAVLLGAVGTWVILQGLLARS